MWMFKAKHGKRSFFSSSSSDSRIIISKNLIYLLHFIFLVPFCLTLKNKGHKSPKRTKVNSFYLKDFKIKKKKNDGKKREKLEDFGK